MSNILIEQMPEAVQIGEDIYPVRSDFRTCLRIILAFEDEDLTPREKIAVLLANLYPEQPADIQEAVRVGVKFLDGGKDPEAGEGKPPARLYSFEKDAQLIYAAFHQTHGIDLETADLHWWKFLAMFMDLGESTAFCGRVALRSRLKRGTASKEERALAAEDRDLFYLPEYHTPEEKSAANEFWRQQAEGEKQRENQS